MDIWHLDKIVGAVLEIRCPYFGLCKCCKFVDLDRIVVMVVSGFHSECGQPLC